MTAWPFVSQKNASSAGNGPADLSTTTTGKEFAVPVVKDTTKKPTAKHLRIELPIKPLSVNKAWQGRRFKTAEAKQYDRLLELLLPKAKVTGEWFELTYFFYLKQFKRTDQQNLLKCLTDCIVRKGIVPDDRFIIAEHIYKIPAKQDSIVVEIVAVDFKLEDSNTLD